MSDEMTTAETMIFEVMVAHRLLGARTSTFAKRHWIKPQLEALEHRGFLTWCFANDDSVNFEVTSAPDLLDTPEAISIIERITKASEVVEQSVVDEPASMGRYSFESVATG